MSEEAKVVEADTPVVEDADPEALFREIGEQAAGLGDGPSADASPKTKEEPKESQEEAPAKKPPASETADDLWKDAPPALREAHEAALAQERTRAEAAETLARRHSGRLSQAHQERQELLAKLTPKEDSTATPKGEEAKDREERRQQLLDEYGDSVGKLIPDILSLEEEIRTLREGQESIKGAQARQAEAQTEELLQEQLVILEQAHPTYRDDVTHPDDREKPSKDRRPNPVFIEWLEKQPAYTQDTVRRNASDIVDGASAADIISRFKRETAPPEDPAKKAEEARRKEQMDAARDVNVRAPGTTKTGAADGDVQGIWNEIEANARRAAR